MQVTTTCPQCGGCYNVEPGLRGRQLRCPNPACRAVFVVAETGAGPRSAPGAPVPSSSFPLRSISDLPTPAPSGGTSRNRAETVSHLAAGTASGAAGAGGEAADPAAIGEYRVLQRLGRGGMGVVYKGWDQRLRRELAIKVMLHQSAAEPTVAERFLREAQAAAGIRSDHAVTIFHVGQHGGLPFIVMECLKGSSLDAYLQKKGNPSIKQVLRMGREAATGLAAAHALGLIHRDIKPSNLFLEAPHGRVKLLDFGLARQVEDNAHLTGSGALLGTPAFMAPEQARHEKLDHRCDLFSLGVVLYRLCTGKQPFSGPSLMAMLMALAVESPVPVRVLNPEVPPGLAELIDQLLEKDPEDRPPSALIVVEALKALEANPAAGADPVPYSVPHQGANMSIPVVCQGCKKSLRIPDSLAGKRVKCPHCKTAIAVPYGGPAPTLREGTPASGQLVQSRAPVQRPPARAGVPAAPPADLQFACPGCNLQVTVASHLAGQVLVCPHCNAQFQVPVAHSGPSVQVADLGAFRFQDSHNPPPGNSQGGGNQVSAGGALGISSGNVSVTLEHHSHQARAQVPAPGLVVTGMVLGIVGFVLDFVWCIGWVFGIILGILGTIFSAIGLVQAIQRGAGKGMAITGLILSIFTIAWGPLFVFVIFAGCAGFGGCGTKLVQPPNPPPKAMNPVVPNQNQPPWLIPPVKPPVVVQQPPPSDKGTLVLKVNSGDPGLHPLQQIELFIDGKVTATLPPLTNQWVSRQTLQRGEHVITLKKNGVVVYSGKAQVKLATDGLSFLTIPVTVLGTVELRSALPIAVGVDAYVDVDSLFAKNWPVGSTNLVVRAEVGHRIIRVATRRPPRVIQRFEVDIEAGKEIVHNVVPGG